MFSNRCIYPAPQHLHASQTLGPGAQCPKAHGSPSLRPTGRVAGGWNVKECGQLGFGVRDRRCGRWRETVVDLTNLTNQEWEWNSGSLPLADPCQIQVDGGLLQDCQARAVLNSASESLAWCGWKMGASEWLITGFQSSTLTYLHGQNWVQIGYLGKTDSPALSEQLSNQFGKYRGAQSAQFRRLKYQESDPSGSFSDLWFCRRQFSNV